MDEAFVIMHLSSEVLDTFYQNAVEPLLSELGLRVRYSKHNEGGDTFINEIEGHIDRSVIVVGDLTNMRPNCYYEVGYAVGRLGHDKVILTARADHHTRMRSEAEGQNPEVPTREGKPYRLGRRLVGRPQMA